MLSLVVVPDAVPLEEVVDLSCPVELLCPDVAYWACVTPAKLKARVPPSTIASASDRLADIEENFMAVPFIDPAILLC